MWHVIKVFFVGNVFYDALLLLQLGGEVEDGIDDSSKPLLLDDARKNSDIRSRSKYYSITI
jgi:hypothetical protein